MCFGADTKRLVGNLRLFEQVDGELERDFIRRRLLGDARFSLSLFEERTKLADTQHDLLGVFTRIRLADRESAHFARVDLLLALFDPFPQSRRTVPKIELLQIVRSLLLLTTNGVKKIFHLSREFVVDQCCQILFEQPRDRERNPTWHQRGPLLEDIVTTENRIDDRRIGTWPTNALRLQVARQRRFRIPSGRLRDMLLRQQVPAIDFLVLRQFR